MGTGVVGFNAKFPVAIMSDINPHLVAFYEGIRTDQITPEIVNAYLITEGRALSQAGDNGYDHYRFIRDRFNAPNGGNPLDFLFLNRAGFNGMIRFSKKGWNIPFCKKPNRFIGMLKTKIVNQVTAVRNIIHAEWSFTKGDFRQTIAQAQAGDIIYCDPPYHGRHADYFTSWTGEDEAELARLLKASPARFILSTWHHSQFRTNESLSKYWADFQMVTRDHFYHLGGKETNRRPMVEALIMNFDPIPPAQIADLEVEIEDEDEAEPLDPSNGGEVANVEETTPPPKRGRGRPQKAAIVDDNQTSLF